MDAETPFGELDATALSVLVCTGVRSARWAVDEALRQPHVDAARGHGIGGWRLLLGTVLPTAANPLLSLFGLSVGALVSGSLVVEVVMGWPGRFYKAIWLVASRTMGSTTSTGPLPRPRWPRVPHGTHRADQAQTGDRHQNRTLPCERRE